MPMSHVMKLKAGSGGGVGLQTQANVDSVARHYSDMFAKLGIKQENSKNQDLPNIGFFSQSETEDRLLQGHANYLICVRVI